VFTIRFTFSFANRRGYGTRRVPDDPYRIRLFRRLESQVDSSPDTDKPRVEHFFSLVRTCRRESNLGVHVIREYSRVKRKKYPLE